MPKRINLAWELKKEYLMKQDRKYIIDYFNKELTQINNMYILIVIIIFIFWFINLTWIKLLGL